MRSQILNLLKQAGDNFLSGEYLAETLNVSRTAIWKHIKALRDSGYDIESVPRNGYRLLHSPDLLSAEEMNRKEMNEFKLREGLNALVRPFPVSVLEAEIVSDDFHARFDAKQREYLYIILNRRAPAALERGKVWHISYPLDEKKMDEAAQVLIGRHDFSTFRAAQCQAKSPVKTLDFLHVWREGEYVFIRAKARSFLHHQVRNFAGALAFVGQGKWTRRRLEEALAAKDRRRGAVTAPADGLYFMKVLYEPVEK